jgi:hypothetical protein
MRRIDRVPDERAERAGESEPAPWLRLYVPSGGPLPRVVPSPVRRDWLPGAAYHCTPLIVGNQVGWTVLCSQRIAAMWSGSNAVDGVYVLKGGAQGQSHFGHGILTMHLGFQLRTSPGVSTWVKAPPNMPKDGVCVLEGLVETDWLDGSFTLNFRLTRPGLLVDWQPGDPLVTLLPFPRGWLERCEVAVSTRGTEWEEQQDAHGIWTRDRAQLLSQNPGGKPARDGAYRRGERHDGKPGPPAPAAKLRLPAFPGLEPGPDSW